MTDITQALKDYNRTQERGNLLKPASTGGFVDFIAENTSTYTNVNQDHLQYLGQRRADSLGNVMTQTLSQGVSTGSDREDTLNKLNNFLGNSTEQNNRDPGYFNLQIKALPKVDRDMVNQYLGEGVTKVKTLDDLRRTTLRMAESRIQQQFPEGPIKQEETDDRGFIEKGFDTIGDFFTGIDKPTTPTQIEPGVIDEPVKVDNIIEPESEPRLSIGPGLQDKPPETADSQDTDESFDFGFSLTDQDDEAVIDDNRKISAVEKSKQSPLSSFSLTGQSGEGVIDEPDDIPEFDSISEAVEVLFDSETTKGLGDSTGSSASDVIGKAAEGIANLGRIFEKRFITEENKGAYRFFTKNKDGDVHFIRYFPPGLAREAILKNTPQNELKKFGQDLQDYAKDINSDLDQSSGTFKTGQVLGQLGTFIGAGFVSKTGSLATAMSSGGEFLLDDYESTLLKKGEEFSQEEADSVALYGTVIGSMESLPAFSAVGRVVGAKTTPQVMKWLDSSSDGVLLRVMKNGVKGGIEEGLQEVVSQLAQNWVAKGLVKYDEERNLFEGSVESAIVGFTAGGVLNGLLGLISGGRRAKGDRSDVVPDLTSTTETITGIDGEVLQNNTEVVDANTQSAPLEPIENNFRPVDKQTPQAFDEKALNDLAKTNTDVDPDATNKYNITNQELIDVGLVARLPEGENISEHVADPRNWAGNTTPQDFQDAQMQDVVFQRLSEKIINNGVAEGNINPDSTVEEINSYVTDVRQRGIAEVSRDLNDGNGLDIDAVNRVREATASNDFGSNLVDTPEVARVRQKTQEDIDNEQGFLKFHQRETNGQGNPDRAKAAYIAIRDAEGTPAQRYAKGVTAYEKAGNNNNGANFKNIGKPFADKLRELSRQNIPISPDQNKVGETGLSTREVTSSLENPDSNFYKELSKNNSVSSSEIQTAVNTGQIDNVIEELRKAATESTQHGPLLNSMANQLQNVETDSVNQTELQKTAVEHADVDQVATRGPTNRLRPTVVRRQKEIYLGTVEVEYDGDNEVDVLNYTHGQQLRQRFPDVETVQQNLGLLTNPDRAKLIVNIVKTANNSSDALARLSAINEKSLRNQITDLVQERSRVDNGQVTDTQLKAKLVDPNTSLLVDDVDNSILRNQVDPRFNTPTEPTKKARKRKNKAEERDSRSVIPEQDVDSFFGLTEAEFNEASIVIKEPITEATAASYKEGKNIITRTLGKIASLPGRYLGQGADYRKGNSDRSVRELVKLTQLDVRSVSDQAYDRSKLFVNDVLKQAGLKNPTTAQLEELDKSLRDPNYDPDLPIELLPAVQIMRGRLTKGTTRVRDAVTRSMSVLESIGVVRDVSNLIDSLNTNMNQYLNTSYVAFEDTKAWRKQITNKNSNLYKRTFQQVMSEEKFTDPKDAEAVIDGVVQYVDNKNHRFGDAKNGSVNLTLEDVFKGQKEEVFSSQGKYKNLSKSKVENSGWFRTALGEIKNGRINYYNSIGKQKYIEADINKDIEIVIELASRGLVSNPADNIPGHVTLDRGSILYNKYSPMQDIAIDRKTLKYLQKDRLQERSNPDMRLFTVPAYLSKFWFLPASLPSWATQVYSAGLGTIQHSFHALGNPRNVIDGFSQLRQIKKGNESGDLEFLADTLSSYGLLDSASTSDLNDLLGDDGSRSDNISPSFIMNRVGFYYGSPDRATKALAFFSMLSNRTRSVQWEVDNGLLPADTNVNRVAITKTADLVADTLPTPQRSIVGAKVIRNPRSGIAVTTNALIASPVITHTTEAPRNAINVGIFIAKNALSRNPHDRKLAGSLSVGSVLMVAAVKASRDAYLSLLDDEDSDDDQTFSALESRDMLPSFAKGEERSRARFDEFGNIRYRSTENINPQSWLTNTLSLAFTQDEGKLFELRDILTNQLFGGAILTRGIQQALTEIKKYENGKIDLEKTIKGVTKSLFANGSINLGIDLDKRFIQDLDLNEEQKGRLDNRLANAARSGEKEIPWKNAFRNVGEEVKKEYSALKNNLREELLDSTSKDFDVKEFSDEIDRLAQVKLDALWKRMPLLSKMNRNISGKITAEQGESAFRSLKAGHGLTNKEFLSTVEAYRRNPDVKPDPRDLGFAVFIKETLLKTSEVGDTKGVTRKKLIDRIRDVQFYREQNRLR